MKIGQQKFTKICGNTKEKIIPKEKEEASTMLIKTLKVLGFILLAIILVVVGYVVYMTVTDYQPEEKIPLEFKTNDKTDTLEKDKVYTATTFNIGYAALDENADFFMEGGSMSRASSKEAVENNLKGISDALKTLDSDFFLIQEIDFKTTRTFKINEYDYLLDNLQNYGSTFAINYKVPWVPVPLTKPMGNITSGLAIYTKYNMTASTRYQFPGEEPWPQKTCYLDRCFIETRYPLANGKDFIMINAHLSAYDASGFIRDQQVSYLKNYLADQYSKGHSIIVGGDWNHQLPGTDSAKFNPGKELPDWLRLMEAQFPNFNWGADAETPSNRSMEQPYVAGQNFLSIIDGFLVSDNIEIVDTKTTDLQFKNADHQPVTLSFKLK